MKYSQFLTQLRKDIRTIVREEISLGLEELAESRQTTSPKEKSTVLEMLYPNKSQSSSVPSQKRIKTNDAKIPLSPTSPSWLQDVLADSAEKLVTQIQNGQDF